MMTKESLAVDERKPAAIQPGQPTVTPTPAPEPWYGQDNDAIRSSYGTPSLLYGTEAAGMTYGQDTSTNTLSTSDEFDTMDDSEILALDLDSIIAHRHTGTHVETSWSIEEIEEATRRSLCDDSTALATTTSSLALVTMRPHVESAIEASSASLRGRRTSATTTNTALAIVDTADAIIASLGGSSTTPPCPTETTSTATCRKRSKSRRRVRDCTGPETKGELKSPPEQELVAVPTSTALVPTSTAWSQQARHRPVPSQHQQAWHWTVPARHWSAPAQYQRARHWPYLYC